MSLESETFELDRMEQYAIECALEMQIWQRCDEIADALTALSKINADAGRQAIDQVCSKIAAVAGQTSSDNDSTYQGGDC